VIRFLRPMLLSQILLGATAQTRGDGPWLWLMHKRSVARCNSGSHSGRVAMVGNGGLGAESDANLKHFTASLREDRLNLTALTPLDDGRLPVVGSGGWCSNNLERGVSLKRYRTFQALIVVL